MSKAIKRDFMTSDRAPDHFAGSHSQKELFESESQEIIDILQRSARYVQELLPAEECVIALAEPQKSTFFLYSTQQGKKPGHIPFQMNEAIKTWLTQSQQPLLITTAEQAALLCVPIPVSHDFLFSIPLSERGHFIGTLSTRSTQALDEHQLRMLSICADQISMTLSAMIQAISERREAASTKARFFSMIAHELRSPLNSINGYLELAMSGAGGELNEQQYEFLQRARMGSESFYALLENLLLISRVDNGQVRLKREIISLQDVVDDAIEELELSASDQHITIEVDGVRAFPKIYADRARLLQVLRNLIDNDLKFTPDGGRIIIIASRDDREKDRSPAKNEQQDEEEMGVLKLQIRDTGVGIATEHHSRIFERSFQVPDRTIGRAGGQGLGLTIVKLIVELHGGSILVKSIPGQGSTFICLLPCILP